MGPPSSPSHTERCGDERGPLLPADPVAAVEHHARRLAPGGVVIISIYARTWSSRRLLRAIGERLELLESNVIRSGHLAGLWRHIGRSA